jgi:hypothetical protein
VVTDDLLHAGRVPPGRQLFTELVERHVPAPSYGDRPWTRPWRRQPSPSIVATAAFSTEHASPHTASEASRHAPPNGPGWCSRRRVS